MKRQSIRKMLIFLSFLLFPIIIYYFSPYLIIEAAAQGILAGSAIIFLVLFFSSLVLGRGFCGWVCPAAGLQEACSMIKNEPAENKKNWIKYLIWFPWIIFILLVALSVGGIKQIDLFFMTNHGISISEPTGYIIYYIVILLIFILALTTGRRGFCHYVCWMAPFMVYGRKLRNIFTWPSLQLLAEKSKCTNCQLCSRNCPMSLDVKEMVQNEKMENAECILCGTCVDTCVKNAIKYSW